MDRLEKTMTARSFRLPQGFAAGSGKLHQEVQLRPARVRDELRALEDFRVYLRPEALPFILLSRTITRLGDLGKVGAGRLESLAPADRLFLESCYREMNGYGGGDDGP
jgi:hypothetical protein